MRDATYERCSEEAFGFGCKRDTEICKLGIENELTERGSRRWINFSWRDKLDKASNLGLLDTTRDARTALRNFLSVDDDLILKHCKSKGERRRDQSKILDLVMTGHLFSALHMSASQIYVGPWVLKSLETFPGSRSTVLVPR
jgi:hypothetical protein